MPERRENCKKQIVSNTNNNRMPEIRENCKNKKSVKLTTLLVLLTICFLQFSLLSGILLLFVLLTICFFTIFSSFRHSIVFNITDYLFLQFSLISGILLLLVLLTICFYNSLLFPAFYCC
jgi:uncharacterized membrane protein